MLIILLQNINLFSLNIFGRKLKECIFACFSAKTGKID